MIRLYLNVLVLTNNLHKSMVKYEGSTVLRRWPSPLYRARIELGGEEGNIHGGGCALS